VIPLTFPRAKTPAFWGFEETAALTIRFAPQAANTLIRGYWVLMTNQPSLDNVTAEQSQP
jgi:hypothetical protein